MASFVPVRPLPGNGLRQRLPKPSPKLVLKLAFGVMRRRLRPACEQSDPGRRFAEIDTFAKAIAWEEGYPIPGDSAFGKMFS